MSETENVEGSGNDMPDLEFTVGDEDLAFLSDDGTEEQDPPDAVEQSITQQADDKKQGTAIITKQISQAEQPEIENSAEKKACDSLTITSNDSADNAAKKRKFAPIKFDGFFDSSSNSPSNEGHSSNFKRSRPADDNDICPPGEDLPNTDLVSTVTETNVTKQQRTKTTPKTVQPIDVLVPPGENNPNSSSCLQDLGKPVCTIAPLVSNTNVIPNNMQKHPTISAPTSYVPMPSYPAGIPNYDFSQQVSPFGCYMNPMPPQPQQCFLPNPSHMYCPPPVYTDNVPLQVPQPYHHVPVASMNSYMPENPVVDHFQAPMSSAIMPVAQQFMPPNSSMGAEAVQYQYAAPPTPSFPQPNTQGPFFPSSCQSSVGPPRKSKRKVSVPPPVLPLNIPLPPLLQPPDPEKEAAAPVKEWKDNFKNVGYFTNIKYLYQNEFKKILAVFGNIKYYKYVCTEKDSYGKCEASFSTRPSLLRAVRLLSKLTVEGCSIAATQHVAIIPLNQFLPDNEKSVDIDCMVKITAFLQSISRTFNWETASIQVKKPTPATTASKPAKPWVPNKDAPRQNLITIRLSAAAKPAAEAAASKEKPSVAAAVRVPALAAASGPVKNSSSARRQSKVEKEKILSNIETITKRINERKERLNHSIEHLYWDQDDSARQGKGRTVSVRVCAGRATIAALALSHMEKMYRANLVTTDNDVVFEVDPETAYVMRHMLHNWRLLDTRLSVVLCGILPGDVEPNYGLVAGRYSKALQKALDAHNSSTKSRLTDKVQHALDVHKFLVEKCSGCRGVCGKCSGACEFPRLHCTDYHEAAQRRRDVRLQPYRPLLCPQIPRCPRGSGCTLAHTETEVLMHPDNFLKQVCKGWTVDRLCPLKRFCFDAHPESPDMFYHAEWEDLYVSGLHNSVLYAAGAIRCLYKLDNDVGLPVLLVTPHANVIKDMASILSHTAKTHGVKLATITTGLENPFGAHVLLGTVSGLLKLFQSVGSSPLGSLRALILDDISALLENRQLLTAFVQLISYIYSHFDNTDVLQKVAVSQEVHKEEVSVAKSLLDTSFTVVGQTNDREYSQPRDSSSPDSIKEKKKDSTSTRDGVSSSPRHSDYSSDSSVEILSTPRKRNSSNSSSSSEERKSPDSFNNKTKKSVHTFNSEARKSSRSFSEERKSPDSFNNKTKKSVHSVNSEARKSSSSFQTDARNSSNSSYNDRRKSDDNLHTEAQKSSDSVQTERRKSSSNSSYSEAMSYQRVQSPSNLKGERILSHRNNKSDYETEDLDHQRAQIPKRNSAITQERIASSLHKPRESVSPVTQSQKGKKVLSAQQFLQEEKQLFQDHEEEYAVFLDMPEMHTAYEEVMEDFTNTYKRQPGGNDDHLWKKYWEKTISSVKEREWQKKRKDLITHYKTASIEEKQQSRIATSDSRVLPESRNSSPDVSQDINLSAAFEVLHQQSDHLGVLGPLLRRLLGLAHDAGIKTIEAITILNKKDNVQLLAMCANTFTKLATSATSASKLVMMKQASVMANGLIVFAEEEHKTWQESRKRLLDLDINSIAQFTLGKSPTDIMKFLKHILKCEKADYVTNEEMNDLFIRISSCHFKMNLSEDTKDPKAVVKSVVASNSKAGGRVPAIKESVIPMATAPAKSMHRQNKPTPRQVPSSSQMAAKSWFVQQVNNIVKEPKLSVDAFNEKLASVLSRKPTNYKFTSKDLSLARELQQLTGLNLSETMFLFAVKKVLEELPKD